MERGGEREVRGVIGRLEGGIGEIKSGEVMLLFWGDDL